MWFDTTSSYEMKFHTMTAGITLVISDMSRLGGNCYSAHFLWQSCGKCGVAGADGLNRTKVRLAAA